MKSLVHLAIAALTGGGLHLAGAEDAAAASSAAKCVCDPRGASSPIIGT